MNAIAQMMDVLRTNPGRLGMVTANGGYLSKHQQASIRPNRRAVR